MCFRPSAVSGPYANTQEATCPTCGMPVEAAPDTTSGTCPYCGDPITSDPVNDPNVDSRNRIL